MLEGLQTVQNVVGVRTTLPILLNVLVTADKNKVSLTTTDLDLTIRCAVDAQVAKAGATTIPVRRLFSIIRELPEGDIEINVDEKDVATVTSGSSFFKIIGLGEDEFPPAPKADGVDWEEKKRQEAENRKKSRRAETLKKEIAYSRKTVESLAAKMSAPEIHADYKQVKELGDKMSALEAKIAAFEDELKAIESAEVTSGQ